MIKYYVTAVLFLLWTIGSYGQSYTVKTSEGKPATIRLQADPANNELKVRSGNRCISIKSFTSLQDQPELINGKWLKVSYNLKCGPGIKKRYTVLWGIRQQQLYEALHLLSEYRREKVMADSTQPSDEYHYYKTKLEFGSKVANVEIYQENYSKQNLLDNYILIFNEVLAIDNQSHTFFTACQELNSDYRLSPGTGKPSTVLSQTYPAIIFRDREYYYINPTWYEKTTGNELVACSQWDCP